MNQNIPDYGATDIVRIDFDTQSAGGSALNRTTAGDVRVYKDGSANERTSLSGITDTGVSGFGGVAGLNRISIDLSDNADAGFYAVGSVYKVVLIGAVIAGQTVNKTLGYFSIGRQVRPATYGQNQIALDSSGRVTVGALADGVITAAKIASDAITSSKIADAAFTGAKFASGAFDAVWSVGTRTLTSIADSSGITTLLNRIGSALNISGDVVEANIKAVNDSTSIPGLEAASADSSWITQVENMPDAVVDEIVSRDIDINVAYVGPLSDTGVISVYQDTDYHLSDDTQLRIPSTSPVNYSGGTPYLQFGSGVSWQGSVVSGGSAGDWDFDFTPSAADTAGAALPVGSYPAEIRVLKSGRVLPPPFAGTVNVVRNL